jgi:SSS family solute:Na+ symporter
MFQWLNVMHMGPSLLPNKQDNAFSVALEAFAPSGLKGVLLAGFFAAIMAAISALANSISTIFTLDVYRKFWKQKASDNELVTTGRITSGAALLIACLLSPLVGKVGLFEYAQIGVTYLATPFISVILLGILWKRTSYKGAIYGLIGGTIIQIVLALVFYATGIHLHWLYVGGIAEVLTIVLIVIVSLTTPPPPDEKVKPFIWRYSWLRVLDDGVKRPWWQDIKLWFGLYALGFIYIYWRFW